MFVPLSWIHCSILLFSTLFSSSTDFNRESCFPMPLHTKRQKTQTQGLGPTQTLPFHIKDYSTESNNNKCSPKGVVPFRSYNTLFHSFASLTETHKTQRNNLRITSRQNKNNKTTVVIYQNTHPIYISYCLCLYVAPSSPLQTPLHPSTPLLTLLTKTCFYS